MRTGVLLLNLGTPDRPDEESVRRYLGEFLMDPQVIDIPWIARFLLVNGIILRTRPKKSAAAYQKVWTERGSPLLFHTLDLAEKVQTKLGDEYRVLPAMRYGKPSVKAAFDEFTKLGVRKVVVLPLYPQFARASTQSSIDWTKKAVTLSGYGGEVSFVPAFYANDRFISAFAHLVEETRAKGENDFTLFTFHGLPERQIRKTDPSGAHCLSSGACCDRIDAVNADCYRAQCHATAHRIAVKAGIPRDRYSIAFQSRLGRTPWIRPYTDFVLLDLAARPDVKRLLVVSPSFVADCLETIEEIGIRARADFKAAGGTELTLVPSLNATEAWVDCVSELVYTQEDSPRASQG